MKTIKNSKTGEIRRVEEKEALLKVGFGWEFINKSVWKEQVRGKHQPNKQTKVEENTISENLSDKKVRKARKEQKRQKYENK